MIFAILALQPLQDSMYNEDLMGPPLNTKTLITWPNYRQIPPPPPPLSKERNCHRGDRLALPGNDETLPGEEEVPRTLLVSSPSF